MSNKTFKVVGITVHNGNAKVRFTDDLTRRVKQFVKGGATRTDFIELPSEMNKLDALAYMLSHPMFSNDNDQATINDTIADRQRDAKRGTVKVKATKPSLDAIKARGKRKTAQRKTTKAAQPTVEEVLDNMISD